MAESLKRNNTFSAGVLTAEEFQRDQHYFLEKLRRHNRSLHGFGVVYGLKAKRQGTQIVVEPGLALDCGGNEIVVAEAVKTELPAEPAGSSTVYLCLRYAERYAEKLCGVDSDHSGNESTLIEETFELVILSQNPHSNHRRQKSRWTACSRPHELALARLQHKAGCWRTDRRYRPPAVK
jgi:hypothetical protein